MTPQAAPALEKDTPSADAQPKLGFAWEPFSLVGRELIPLMRLHWQEKSSWREMVDLDLDWVRLFHMETSGALHLLTVRDGDVIVGYMPVIVTQHIMATGLRMGIIDTYMLHPAYRSGWTIVKMLKKVVKHLEHLGVDVVSARDPEGEMGPIFKRLGFGTPEMTWFKKLEKSV